MKRGLHNDMNKKDIIINTTGLDHPLTKGRKMNHNKAERDQGRKTKKTNKKKRTKRTKNIKNKKNRAEVTLDLHQDRKTEININRKTNNIGRSKTMM